MFLFSQSMCALLRTLFLGNVAVNIVSLKIVFILVFVLAL